MAVHGNGRVQRHASRFVVSDERRGDASTWRGVDPWNWKSSPGAVDRSRNRAVTEVDVGALMKTIERAIRERRVTAAWILGTERVLATRHWRRGEKSLLSRTWSTIRILIAATWGGEAATIGHSGSLAFQQWSSSKKKVKHKVVALLIAVLPRSSEACRHCLHVAWSVVHILYCNCTAFFRQ